MQTRVIQGISKALCKTNGQMRSLFVPPKQVIGGASQQKLQYFINPRHGPGCGCCFCSMSGSGTDDVTTFSSVDELIAKVERLEQENKELRLHNTLAIAQNRDMEEDPDISVLLENNVNWVREQSEKDPKFFDRIGKKQTPKYLYIGCADSRVPANEILGLGPGEVFVHRNVGNQVIGSDLNVLSCVQFAVEHLNVQHIIVTGHYDCGAVRAATQPQDLGLLENWLRSIRDVYRIHHNEMLLLDDGEAKHRKLVELNVVEQCLNLYKTGIVQKRRKESALAGQPTYPRIHAMVFDPKVGILHKLPVNFKKTIAQFKDIYNLY